jgi:hypothetical protein
MVLINPNNYLISTSAFSSCSFNSTISSFLFSGLVFLIPYLLLLKKYLGLLYFQLRLPIIKIRILCNNTFYNLELLKNID